jgi:hypothetical protein
MLETIAIQKKHSSHRPLTPWELPQLLTPMHQHKATKKRKPVERPHYLQLLTFIYRNRFAVANQIQRRFTTLLRSDRTTRRHLEELQSLGYLATAPARGVSPLFPKILYVTGRGVKKIAQAYEAKGKTWSPSRIDRAGRHTAEGYSAEHLIHEVFITEFLLGAWKTGNDRKDIEVLTIQRRSLFKHPAFGPKAKGRLTPDAMFVFRQDGGLMVGFVELDTGTMNKKQLVRKFRRYQEWSQSAAGREYLIDLYRRHGAKEPRPVFRLYVIAQDRDRSDDGRRLATIAKAARIAAPALADRVRLTTVTELQAHFDQAVLVAPIWHRVNETVGQTQPPLRRIVSPPSAAINRGP